MPRALILMLLVTLSQPALAGRRKAALLTPEVPPVPAALSLPADRAPVHADVGDAPALLGSNLDLASLSRTKITWTIGSDLSFLGELDKELTLLQLAADPRWRVGREEGGVVAVERTPVEGRQPTWTMPWHGYRIEPERCARTALTFEPRTRDWAWEDSEVVSHSQASDASHTITALKLLGDACRDQMGTALVVEGPVQLEIFEGGDEEDRPHTIGVVDGIQKLREIPFSDKQIRGKGYSARMLPTDGVRRGHPSLELEDSSSGLLLEAWQNPGQGGWSWLRILDGKLRPWEEEAVATATLERVGFSPDPQEHFLMQAEIPLPDGRGFSGTAEIWMVPDDGGPPVRVDTTPIRIPAR